MKGYMRIEPVLDFGNKICSAWYFDPDDPDETTIVLDTLPISVLDFGNKICSAWYFDPDDPDETTIVLDTRKIYLVADRTGNPIPDSVTHEPAVSTAYDDIGVDKPADIR